MHESAKLRILIVLGACIMAPFTMFWTGLTFLSMVVAAFTGTNFATVLVTTAVSSAGI